MSKCLKCGAALPPVGECPTCAAAANQPAAPGVPSLLNKDLQIDRRSRTPESTPAVTGAAVPSFAELERAPAPSATPPGMMPARQAAPPPGAVPPAMRPAPRSPTPMPIPAAPASMTPPQRMPVPAPMAAPPVSPPPHAAPRGPSGVALPTAAQGLEGDPDQTLPDTLPGMPVPKTAFAPPPPPPPTPKVPEVPAPAIAARVTLDDPDSTAPGGPPPSVAPPPEEAPATGALPLPRHATAPAEVVTFSAPGRLPVPPAPSRTGETAAAPAKARPQKPVSTGDELHEVHARPASLWRRLLSFTIDTAALVGVASLYILLASSIAGVKKPSSQGLTPLDSIAAWMHALKSVLLPGIILLLVLATVYCAVAAFLWNGRTLGRLLLGLRLVDTHGLAPAPSRAIVRALLSVVSFGLFLGGFWMALFDRRGQTLHDKLTSTFVVQPS